MTKLEPRSVSRCTSVQMSHIMKTDTKPELAVRSMAHQLGYRFRLHRNDLPGTPDLAFPKLKKAIFVHGCFWHRHACKDGQKVPNGNHSYWLPKFARNMARDVKQEQRLKQLGWQVLTIWECELRHREDAEAKIDAFLAR